MWRDCSDRHWVDYTNQCYTKCCYKGRIIYSVYNIANGINNSTATSDPLSGCVAQSVD